MFFDFSGLMNNAIGITSDMQWKLIDTIIIFIVAWIMQYLLFFTIGKQVKDPKMRYKWRKLISYTLGSLAIIVAASFWVKGIADLATFVGLVSAGLAVALKEPLGDIAGWVFILWRKPFDIGDRIQIGEFKGDVIDRRIFMFTILEVGNWVEEEQSTGRIIHIPNGRVFIDGIANYNKGFDFIWNEIPVHITFESNWEKALELLDEVVQHDVLHLSAEEERQVKEKAEQMMIFYNKLTPKVYLCVDERGIVLTIRYLCNIRNRRGSSEIVWKDILTAFKRETDIHFAYPTQRVYYNPNERKEATSSTKSEKGLPNLLKDFLGGN